MTAELTLTDTQKRILEGKVCPYCKGDTEFVDSTVVYGRSYGMIYLCRPCDAYCGVHKGTDKSLGRLANKELRQWKKDAHAHFDKIWQDGHLKRTSAYQKLSQELGIDPQYTHIGMFSVETCKRVVEWAKNFKKP